MILTKSFQHEEVQGVKFGYAPIGKPQLYAHVYFVDGLLIDTGQSRTRSQVLTAVKPLNVQQIFITHFHEDHTGNIEAVQQLHDCPIYASPLCCELMKAPPKISFAQQLTWGNRPSYGALIPIEKTLSTPQFTFQLLPIPGHAPDMLALYEPNRKWLFSADLYLNSYIDYFLKTESMATQIESIKRILQLDFDILFCSHKPQLTNGKQQLAKKLNFLEGFFHEATKLHEKGCNASEIFKRMKLKENWFVRILSGGDLSKMNMVKAVIRDLEHRS